jgi:hypothetical protein
MWSISKGKGLILILGNGWFLDSIREPEWAAHLSLNSGSIYFLIRNWAHLRSESARHKLVAIIFSQNEES